jgi:cysteine desulfurase
LHIVTTEIEHPSVLQAFRDLSARGARVDYLGVDARGVVRLADAERVIAPETTLVSVMQVNNEVGAIQPVAEIARLARAARGASTRRAPEEHAAGGGRGLPSPYLHTDASQAPLWLSVRADELGADLISIDAQKICGPKGAGALYIRAGVALEGLFRGGKQERGLRPGTEPVPLIAGLAAALDIAEAERAERVARVGALRDYFIREVCARIPGAVLNGHPSDRLANNVNFSFPGFEHEYLLVALDEAGIACSARSACIEGGDGSYVVRALSGDDARAGSSIRFSLGTDATRADVDYCADRLAEIIGRAAVSADAPTGLSPAAGLTCR